MSKKLRNLCIALVFILILSSSSKTAFAASSSDFETANASTAEAEIERLFDQRAALLAQIFGDQERREQTQNERISALNAIDMELTRKGVSFLSLEEVYEQFPETKNNKTLALSGMTMSDTNGAQPSRADIPDSAVNSWASYRSICYANGIVYNVQRLVAQPSDPSSPLAEANSRTVSFRRNWEAGAVNVVSTLAEAVVGAFTGEIPGASFALSFFDAVESFISGISTTTEVDVPHIVYSWSLVTTASFSYVKQNNQTDDYQWLSLVCTKTATEVAYQIPSFDYVNSNGTTVLNPLTIQGRRVINNMPSDYNSDRLAVTAYISVSQDTWQNCIGSIDITAPEAKRVEKIYPCCPWFPLHCEF